MTAKKDKQLDDFLESLVTEDSETLDDLSIIAESLQPIATTQSARSALLGALPTSRFERFTIQVATLLDIDESQALTLLDAIDDSQSWEPGLMEGMALYHVEGGPAVERAITGFIRLESGQSFPPHTHIGDESVLILQGHYIDGVSGKDYGPGDIVQMPAGTSHSFQVLAQSTGLLYLAVVQEGLEIDGVVMRYDDPNI